MKNWLNKNYLLLLIIIIGFLLRLAAALKYGQFWDDEMFSFFFSQKSWGESLRFWLWETNPPLHLFLLKLWFYLLPAGEFSARFLSLIFGVATIPLIYLLGEKWQSKTIGLVAALFLALQPYHIFWSATARAYALLIFLTVLAVYFFYLTFFQGEKKYLGLAISNFLLLFTHLSAIFIIFVQLVCLLHRKQDFKRWWKINFLSLATAGAWIIYSLFLKMENQLPRAWFFNLSHDWTGAFSPLSNLFFGLPNAWSAMLVLIPLIFLLTIFLAQKIKAKDQNFLLLSVFAFLPILFSLLLGPWHIKFFLVSLPFIILLIAAWLSELFNRQKTAFLVIALLCAGGILQLFSFLPLTNWQKLEKYLQTSYQPDKNQVFIYNNYVLKPQIQKYLSAPQKIMGFNEEKNWDEWVIKNNYLYLAYSPEEIQAWGERNEIFKYHEIFLLQGEYSQMPQLNTLFSEYILKEKFSAPILGRYYLYHYEKN